MKLGLYQSLPTDGDEEAAFSRIRSALTAAGAAGADLVVFPELMLPGYNRPDLHVSHAQPCGGTWEQQLSDLCSNARCGAAVGWAERDGREVYNAASVFDAQGTVVARYRKRQLFGPVEKSVFTPGDDLCVFDFAGRTAALLICYDVEFADLVQRVAEQAVDVLLVPTANPAGFEIVQDVLVRARAYETRMSIAYANYCGSENGLPFGGQSLIAGPDGQILARAGATETLLLVDVPSIASFDPQRLSTQHLDRRPLPRAGDD